MNSHPLTHDQLLVGDRIDRLMTVEFRPLSGGLPPGYVEPLYQVCRNHHGVPLSMLAGSKLKNTVGAADTVYICTGAGIAPNLPFGETDGPPGAAVLARALVLGLGCSVVMVTEQQHLAPVQACVDVINADLPGSAAVTCVAFSKGLGSGRSEAAELFAATPPKAVVFVERDGPNAEGYFHGVRGDFRQPEDVGHVYLLADLARDNGVLSIGIGDGGNEVGFGDVRAAVANAHPFKGMSKGGFESGLVTVTATDVVVAASVSNWGAYGVAAGLAYLCKQIELIHSPGMERDLVEASVRHGARDGATSRQENAVDGLDLEGHAAFVHLLSALISISL